MSEPSPQQRASRARRLAEVFGDVLPDQTRDDTDAETDSSEARLLREVPPHHGGS